MTESTYTKTEIERVLRWDHANHRPTRGFDDYLSDILACLPDYENLPPFIVMEIRWLRDFAEELLDRLKKSHPMSDDGLRRRYKAGPEAYNGGFWAGSHEKEDSQ